MDKKIISPNKSTKSPSKKANIKSPWKKVVNYIKKNKDLINSEASVYTPEKNNEKKPKESKTLSNTLNQMLSNSHNKSQLK